MKLETGKIQVYTGDGKGKTTAAIGLAVRAAGAGLKVFMAQFVKQKEYSEIRALKRFSDTITVRQYGRGCFIIKEPAPEDIEAAQSGLREVAEIMASGEYSVVILDEASIAIHFHLFSTDQLLEAIQSRPDGVEVIITGRNAPDRLIEAADLVTEMKEVRHYYTIGLEARTGIEK